MARQGPAFRSAVILKRGFDLTIWPRAANNTTLCFAMAGVAERAVVASCGYRIREPSLTGNKAGRIDR
jgi:hypothetical protein